MFLVRRIQWDQDDAVVEGVGGDQRLAVRRDGQTADDRPALRVGDIDAVRVAQVTTAKIEGVDAGIFAAADEKPPAVGGERQAVKRLLDVGPRNDPRLAALEVNDNDVVIAVPAMENC